MIGVRGDIKSVLEYFEGLLVKVPDIKAFIYGGVEMGIDRAVGDPNYKYPLLWMEQPGLNMKHNGGNQWYAEYDMGINLMTNTQNDYKAERKATEDMQAIAYRVIKQMNKDFKNLSIMDMNRTYDMAEVDRGWALNHVGWRIGFTMCFRANELVGA